MYWTIFAAIIMTSLKWWCDIHYLWQIHFYLTKTQSGLMFPENNLHHKLPYIQCRGKFKITWLWLRRSMGYQHKCFDDQNFFIRNGIPHSHLPSAVVISMYKNMKGSNINVLGHGVYPYRYPICWIDKKWYSLVHEQVPLSYKQNQPLKEMTFF